MSRVTYNPRLDFMVPKTTTVRSIIPKIVVETTTESMPPDDELHSLTWTEQAMWVALYGLVAFLAVFGNILVIYVVYTSKK